jgi:hypothetical protein
VEERFAAIENEIEKDPDPEMKKFAAYLKTERVKSATTA